MGKVSDLKSLSVFICTVRGWGGQDGTVRGATARQTDQALVQTGLGS